MVNALSNNVQVGERNEYLLPFLNNAKELSNLSNDYKLILRIILV